MDLQFGRKASGLGGWKRGIQGCRAVDIELIHDQHDPRGVGIVLVHQRLDTGRELSPGAPRPDGGVAPAA